VTYLYSKSVLTRKMKVLFRSSAMLLILAAVVLLHGRATAPIVEAETTQEVLQDGLQASLTSGNADIDKLILEAGKKYGVDPKLVYYVIRQESRFKPQAASNKNAQGLMQLIPATAERFHIANIRDPEQNIDGGVRYLRWLLKRFKGDVNLALAGYNAGEGAVEKCGNKVPDFKETKNYVAKITKAYGKTYHPVLDPEQARTEFGSGLAATE
jgi:soluble lytic murein transglycosylase-like protein